MSLQTLLGNKRRELSTGKSRKLPISLKKKFDSLVKACDLEFYPEKNGLLRAGDDTGLIMYKKVKDFEWFGWEPWNFEKIAEDIYNLTGGYLLSSDHRQEGNYGLGQE